MCLWCEIYRNLTYLTLNSLETLINKFNKKKVFFYKKTFETCLTLIIYNCLFVNNSNRTANALILLKHNFKNNIL